MLKQTQIQLDFDSIIIIQQQSKFKEQQRLKYLYKQRLDGILSQADKRKYQKQLKSPKTLTYSKQQIFPKGFTSFNVDSFTKQSNFNLYKIPSHINPEEVNQRIKVLLQVLNSFKNKDQKQSLAQILRLNDLSEFLLECSSDRKSDYVQYFKQGKSLSEVQNWIFKHQDQQPTISYEQRQQIFNKIILFIKFVTQLFTHKVYSHIKLTSEDIVMLKFDSLNEFKSQYQIKIQLCWLYNIILKQNYKEVKEFTVLQNLRKILLKIVGIPNQRQQQNQPLKSDTDKKIFEKISFLVTFNDIIKLHYSNCYTNPKKYVYNNINSISQRNYQQKIKQGNLIVENFKQNIIKIQELSKKQLIGLKPNQKSILKQMNPQVNKHFWSTLTKYIQKNISENQRKAILNPNISKKVIPPQSNKKIQKAKVQGSPTKGVKTQLKLQQTKPKKQQLKQFDMDLNIQKQINAVPYFLSSGSGLKFRPEKLIALIQGKQKILYVLKCRNKISSSPIFIVAFINGKTSLQNSVFGQYCTDQEIKSFIYSEKSEKFYNLKDKNHAVGYGPQIFIVIGKLDIIIPGLRYETIQQKQLIQCSNYFPTSYSQKGIFQNQFQKIQEEQDQFSSKQQKNKQKIVSVENQIGLQKQFYLEQIDIYEIKMEIKVKS